MTAKRVTAPLVFIFLPIFWILAVIPAAAAVRFNVPVQVTTNPGEDFAATLSPDGKSMVYVSDRSGNLDLWLKRLGKGIQPPDEPLTNHSAEDNAPRFHKSGRKLVFVSHRSDPKGDLYILDLDSKNAETGEYALTRLTQDDLPELDPAWSADGKALYFTSIAGKFREQAIFKIDIASGTKTRVVESGGNPAVSPDGKYLAYVSRDRDADLWVQELATGNKVQITSGPEIEVSPEWSADGTRIYFNRYENDTNYDGDLTIDDNPNIWSVAFAAFKGGVQRQLTDSSTYDLLPSAAGDGRLYYTSNRRSGIDVWSIPPEGIFPKAKNYGLSLQVADDNCGGNEKYSYPCLLAYQNLIREYDGEEGLSRIRYRLAKGYAESGYPEEAAQFFTQIVEKHPERPAYQGLSEIELLLLRLERAREEGPTVHREKVKDGLDTLDAIARRYQEHPQVVARAYLESGNLHFMLEDQAKALSFYKKVMQEYPSQRVLSAAAAFSQSQIYSLVGDQERLVGSYVQVVEDYYDVDLWSDSAVEEILSLFEKQPTLEKKVSSLQALTAKYKDLPRLGAAVQNRIGQLYHEANENLLAKEAYRRTLEKYPKADTQTFRAKMALANIYSEEENFEQSLNVLKEISDNPVFDEQELERARQGFVRKTLEKGTWELRVGEIKLARKTFRRLIDTSPDTVEAHRGYLQASAILKEVAKTIPYYEKRVAARPDSATDHYALGLAVTYLDPPDLDRAEKEIGVALGLDSQQVFFHQTLGWIYEQKERSNPGKDYLERALYEYQTALALNDASRNAENEADLLLNLGNGHYLLKNHYAAYQYYDKRNARTEPFFDENREAVFRQRYGESAFRAGFHDVALTQLKKALTLVSKKKDLSRMAELNDRIALVYQDQGDHAPAVEYFSKTLELNREAGNQASLTRSLRNIANNLVMLNQSQEEPDIPSLNQALNNYFQAIDNLEKHGVVQKGKAKKKSGLFGVAVETGLDADASSAATGFDKTGEEKLIFHYIGKIYGDFGEYGKAIEYFEKKLALIPENLDVQKNIPVLLEKALLQNQIGNFYYKSGDADASRKYFRDSYAVSKQLNNKHGIAVNAANIARTVFSKSQTTPLPALRGEIEDTVRLLEEAAEALEPVETLTRTEDLAYLKNYLGIFTHALGYRLPAPVKASIDPRQPDGGLKAQLIASTEGLKRQADYVKRSQAYFNEAEALLDKAEGDHQELKRAIAQNKLLAEKLTGSAKKAQAAAGPPPWYLDWRYRYQESLVAPPKERFRLLMEAESLLSGLPYGLVENTPSTLILVEDLYRTLTQFLFNAERYDEALHYSEKGRQQLIILLRPEVQLNNNEERRTFYEDLSAYAERLKEARGEDAEEEREAIIEEYREILSILQEEDPALAALFAPHVPDLTAIQENLKPGQSIVKYQKLPDGIRVWDIRPAAVRGARLNADADLNRIIVRLAQEQAPLQNTDVSRLSQALIAPVSAWLKDTRSLYLIADGALEFLPWAAFSANGRTLAESMPVTFLSSLSQLALAERKKNLYNSRFLGVNAPGAQAFAPQYATVVNLTGEKATREEFRSLWAHYGVVHIEGKTHLNARQFSGSYFNLDPNPRQFQRVSLKELFGDAFEPNFIALTDLAMEFKPEISLSPTALLIQGLTFKGYPGILLRSGPKDAALHDTLMRHFYEDFRNGNPSESLRKAQVEAARLHPGSLAWTGYRYYGFSGMDPEEKNQFAETHFMKNAQGGARAILDKDWLSAIDRLEKSLALLDFLKDKSLAPKIYKSLAQAAYNIEDYPKAIAYQKDLLKFVENSEDPEERAEALYFLGILYSRAEQYPTAVDHLRQALKIYEENEILDRLAENYSTLGIVEENALDYDQALEAFNASLKINEEIGEDLNRGRELRRIGRIYYLRLNQYGQALRYFSAAFKLFKELDHAEQMVETLLELGLVSEKQGDFAKALEFYTQAQAMATKHDLKGGLSKALLYQANSYWFQGDYQKAFRFQRESLDIAEAIEDVRQQAFIHNTLGLIHWTLNDSERALRSLNRSLELAKQIHSPLDIASANNNIGLVHRKDKRYEESIEFFNRALEQDIKLKSKWGQGYTHRNLGMSKMRLKRLDEAEPHIDKAIALSREIGNRTNLVKSMLESGHLALERNQCEKAVPIFEETGTLAETLNIREVLWRALRGQGVCLKRANQRAEAVEVYKKAVDVVDKMRAAIKVEEFQNGFLTDKQDVYKELILLLLDMGKAEAAFNFAEKAKARSFIDLLGNQKISLKNDVSQKLYDALTEQKKTIRMVEDALGAARSQADEEKMKTLSARLVSARTAYQDLLIRAKEQSPEISSFVTVESITLKELDAYMEEPMALLEYLVTENELVIWVVVKGGIDVVRVPVKEADISRVVKDYRKRIQQLAPVEDQLSQLYNWLMRPVEKFTSQKRVLAIVPHSHLHYVAYASLKDGESYLIEKHPLFYSPSASVLRYTFKRKFEKSAQIKVLALGNPDLGDFNYDLPLAEMEAKSIRWEFPRIDILTRDKATESWLQKHISDYQIIHIASHGEFDPINPLFSSLKLTKDKSEDGNFEVNEVFSLQINADIVTLSACQTGLGEITAGDDLVGLNRAFIYAGTHSLLSSLWRVSDISTAVLIKHFYRNYVQNDKAESLRKAQLLVKNLYPHPSYWAGFNLTGDFR